MQHPYLAIDYMDQDDGAECDADMKDDDGNDIPFCEKTFKFEVKKGKEELVKYVTMTVTDRDEEVGQVRLKMQTLINGGKPINFQGMSKKMFIEELESQKENWYPIMSDLQITPGSLLV